MVETQVQMQQHTLDILRRGTLEHKQSQKSSCEVSKYSKSKNGSRRFNKACSKVQGNTGH